MFCMAAQSLGYKVAVLDPGDHSPAGSVADRHIRADYLDPRGLADLAAIAAAATTEFENVPAEALAFLARTARVSPAAASVAIAQDRIEEKKFLERCGVDVAPYVVLRDGVRRARRYRSSAAGDRQERTSWLRRQRPDPRNDRRRRGRRVASDGRQAVCARATGCAGMRDFGRRGAQRARRDSDLAVAENLHRDGILDVSIVPARVPEALADKARATATTIAARLDYQGVLCVEMFVTTAGALLVNEIAPRPHNSGHYTIDACVTSQFEQQARVLAGLPLGSTRQHEPAVMVNLLGDVWFESAKADVPREPDWAQLLRHPQAKLHLYGKAEARRGRKMGHVTCVAPTLDEALAAARAIRSELGLRSPINCMTLHSARR
jgi:5-(carboxyamino)imidazole ribonucleotide synthase